MQRCKLVPSPIVILSLSILLVTAFPTFSCDLWGLVSITGVMNDTYMTESRNIFVTESQNEEDDEGWGFVAWDFTGSPTVYRTNLEVYNDDVPATNLDWSTDYGVVEPDLFLVHSRRSNNLPNAADPHPFIYKLNGRTLGFAHNGGIDDLNSVRYLISQEFDSLDIMHRYYDMAGHTIDSEIYGKYLVKNILLADNYNLGDQWAVESTMAHLGIYLTSTDDYSSLNMLYANGHDLFAVCKNSSTNDTDHKLWYRAFNRGLYGVLSKDTTPGAQYAQINSGNYKILSIGESATVSEPIPTTVSPPDYSDYKLSSYDNNSTVNSQYVKTASNALGHFAAVWQEGGIIKIRVTDQLGLAEQEEMVIIDADTVYSAYPNICSDPETNKFYVVYATKSTTDSYYRNICIRELTYETFYEGYDTSHFIPIKKWVIGTKRILNQRATPEERVAYPAIATAGTEHIVVWQSLETTLSDYKIKLREITSSTLNTQVTITTPAGVDCYRPDIDYLYGEDDSMATIAKYAIAWKQYSADTSLRGIGGAIHNSNIYMAPFAISSKTIINIPTTNATYCYPSVSGTGNSWVCSFKNRVNSTEYYATTCKFYSNPQLIPLNGNGVQVGDPWYSILDTYSTPISFEYVYNYLDNAAKPNGDFEVVFAGNSTFFGGYQIYFYTNVGNYINSISDNANDVEKPLYPSMAISNDYDDGTAGTWRRLVAWEKEWDNDNARRITATFSPYHFRTGAFRPTDDHLNQVADIPLTFELGIIYPNPFNPTTNIPFKLPETSDLKISVFNINGQLVKTLVDRQMSAGEHQIVFDGSGLSSGVYFVRMQAGDFIQSKKIILMK